MKNTKSLKIALLVISAALLLGAAVGITASAAEETSAPVVYSQNVEYGGNYALMYAITAESVTGETVSLAVYNNAECAGDPVWSKTVAATEANQETVKGKACYVFATNGIAAKNMDVQYYVKVTAANGETVKRYSVVEYLYERLYKNGIASSTEEGDIKRAELYNTILLYGKQAQDVLFNYNTDENGALITTDDRTTFVTDMKYVFVADDAGAVDGFVGGIYLDGAKVSFSALDASTTGYVLYDAANGESIDFVALGNTYTVDGHHIKAVATDTNRGTGKYANQTRTIDYTDATLDALKSAGKLTDNSKIPLSGTKKVTFSDGSLVFTSSGSSWGGVDFYGGNIYNSTYALETDIYLEGCDMEKARVSYFVGSKSTQIGSAHGNIYGYGFNFYVNPDTEVGGYVFALKNVNTTDVAVVPDSEWTNIRYEIDGFSANSAARFYVNNVLVIDTTLTAAISTELAGVQFAAQSNNNGNGFSSGTMKLDNTYVGPIPFSGVRGTGNYTESALNYTDKAYSDLTADGTFTNVNTGATVSVCDVGGDDAFKLSYTANTTWGRYSIKSADMTEAQNIVFETDILFDNINIPSTRGFEICGTSNLSASAGLFSMRLILTKGENDGEYLLKMNGSDATYKITEGEWINLRFEADGLVGGKATRLIINGKTVAEGTLDSAIENIAGVQLMCQSTFNGVTGFTGDVYLDNTYLGPQK